MIAAGFRFFFLSQNVQDNRVCWLFLCSVCCKHAKYKHKTVHHVRTTRLLDTCFNKVGLRIVYFTTLIGLFFSHTFGQVHIFISVNHAQQTQKKNTNKNWNPRNEKENNKWSVGFNLNTENDMDNERTGRKKNRIASLQTMIKSVIFLKIFFVSFAVRASPISYDSQDKESESSLQYE